VAAHSETKLLRQRNDQFQKVALILRQAPMVVGTIQIQMVLDIIQTEMFRGTGQTTRNVFDKPCFDVIACRLKTGLSLGNNLVIIVFRCAEAFENKNVEHDEIDKVEPHTCGAGV